MIVVNKSFWWWWYSHRNTSRNINIRRCCQQLVIIDICMYNSCRCLRTKSWKYYVDARKRKWHDAADVCVTGSIIICTFSIADVGVWSRRSVVCVVIRLRISITSRGKRFFSSPEMFIPTMGPTHPFIQRVLELFPGSKVARAWSWSLVSI